MRHVALVGNPNTGKSSLFNCLTGLRQHIGNYPGVTVEKKLGYLDIPGEQLVLVDLPGTYSLTAQSVDERIVADVLSGKVRGMPVPDLIVCVADVTNLKRHLFLALQIAELGIPLVLALNFYDELKARKISIEVEKLRERLGVPLVLTAARKTYGMHALRQAIKEALRECPKLKGVRWPESIEDSTRKICECGQSRRISAVEARRLLFDQRGSLLSECGQSRGCIEEVIGDAHRQLWREGWNPASAEAVLTYRHIDTLLEGVVSSTGLQIRRATKFLDKILMHRFFGLLVFLGIMYLVFQSVYSWANPFIDWIDGAKGAVQSSAEGFLVAFPLLSSLVVDGVIEGLGAFLVFLPQIIILFAFISILEESGYMARAAFLMDKLLAWCGLGGKSFVPMLSSYACAIPGILAARTIENPKVRATTIFVAPFVSCSARLPVYALMIGAFIAPKYGGFVAGMTLFAMHFVGLVVAVPVAWVITRFFLRTRSTPFLMELPSYRLPRIRGVLHRIWGAGKEFVRRAGTVILAMTIVIWALSYFPRDEELVPETKASFVAKHVAVGRGVDEVHRALLDEDSSLSHKFQNELDKAWLENSYIARMGKALQPIFEPAGFDWRITVGVVASFPAREVVLSALGVIHAIGGEVDSESKALRDMVVSSRWEEGPRLGMPVFTLPVAVALMVFFALCQQCASTLAIIAQELNAAWALASFVLMTLLAWVGAVVSYQFLTYVGL